MHVEILIGQSHVKADRQKQNRRETKRPQNNVVAIFIRKIRVKREVKGKNYV